MPEQQKEKKDEKIYAPEEIHEMFNTCFLPKLQEFAKRTKKEMFPDEEIACFQALMFLEFSDLDSPLTYESISTKVNLQLQAVLQKEVDKQKEEKTFLPIENTAKDTGDAPNELVPQEKD